MPFTKSVKAGAVQKTEAGLCFNIQKDVMNLEEYRTQLLAYIHARKQAIIDAREQYDEHDKYSKGLIAGLELAENLIRAFQAKF